MATPIFRLVCPPAALDGAPQGWASEMLRNGEPALLVTGGELSAVDAAAHALGLLAISVLRREETEALQEETVIAYAASLPLVWVAGRFSEAARAWARDRGPMSLLVEADGALPEPERSRIDRFVRLLGRQVE